MKKFVLSLFAASFLSLLTACGGGEEELLPEAVEGQPRLEGSTPGEGCGVAVSCPHGPMATDTGIVFKARDGHNYCSAPYPSREEKCTVTKPAPPTPGS